MRKILSFLLIVSMLIIGAGTRGIAENTDNSQDTAFSIFNGVSWGDDIEHVKTVTGCTKSTTIAEVVTYLEFQTPFATETATTQMFFIENRLSTIMFLFILPHDGFAEELTNEIESEFGEYTLTEDQIKQWILQDGTMIEITSNKNAITLTVDHTDELLKDRA